ncbi:MAG: hypothetical protein JWP23_2638 [Phenylobacterium sp.]|nr:hypothetical protein [Phenylobacterium sp.]
MPGESILKRLVTFAACAALPISLLLACSPQEPAAPAGPTPKFNTDALPMPEFMGHVVDPASFAYWKGSGTEETAKGTKELAPTTEAGWEAMETAAAVLIEAGNALQLPGRARAPEADWYRFAQQLSAEAVLAKAAAGKHDKAGVYTEGAKLYEICTACHKEYVIDPGIKANGPAKGDPLPDWPADVAAKQKSYQPK